MIFDTFRTVITDGDWFISDTHFGHANIMKYCNRPFCCKHQMNEVMIARWNSVVGVNDRVFFGGDFAWGSKGQRRRMIERLNGEKICIRGNHDKERQWMVDIGFAGACLDVEGSYVLPGGIGGTIYIRHLPNWKRAPEFDLHLCGHVHDSWRRIGNVINMSADVVDFTPVKLSDLMIVPEDPPGSHEIKNPEHQEKMRIKNKKLKERLYGRDD